MNNNLSRRSFLSKSAVAGAGVLILPSGSLFGKNRPGNKLNIALIGCWGRAQAHFNMLDQENVVALCDVNSRALGAAAKRYPKAKHYKDWRKCLDQKDLDAIVVCTPDHHHAFISIWAMNRGLHVYGEKPLANSVEEARLVRETYIANRSKVATQCGTQRHFDPNFAYIRELIHEGAIGDLKDVHAWGNRYHNKTSYPKATGSAPDFIDWDLWVGPSPMHPFSEDYFIARDWRSGKETHSYFNADPKTWPRGSNCLSWNMYRDFGNWQIGDMGSHTMDLAFNPLDADYPISAQAEGEPYNPEVSPSRMSSSCINPANEWRGAIRVSWHQGGNRPKNPLKYVDLGQIGHGALFKGSKGFIVADFTTRTVIPYGKAADLSYYDSTKIKVRERKVANFSEEWTHACKTDLQTSCNFDYSGVMIEQLLLGSVAFDVGKKLEYNAKKMEVTNSPEANRLLRKEYRKGWVLNG
ncbi:Gfo/Idh/MocA family protein [Pelagicoccus mobilis]|uniref:Gfo/Idh/MocA family oxidoreductase n=1 Tax=Pelagicoccus mobilis TaxID=415221 RepID=A0A934VP21_9BACT|nr:Gfo/Idh/MocA family oxidoreductase [Pelagicoccus mobilis]MBK1875360.1 Gfo/Idh/MocA family oxidoreductase [Pelagicoccus mobilis]